MLGPTQWFGIAEGLLEASRGFAGLCEREPKLLDFGGGWPTHLLDSPLLVELLSVAQSKFPSLENVQFKPGKAIAERAGVILTKVLEIREVCQKTPRTKPGSMFDVDDDSESDSEDEVQRAVTVYASISDTGSTPTHVHPLLWKQKNSNDWETAVAWSLTFSEQPCLFQNLLLQHISSSLHFVLLQTAGDEI